MKKLFLAFVLIASCFALTTPVSAAGSEKNYVRFYNYSDYTVVKVYASRSDNGYWGNNLMSGYVMGYNQYFDVVTNYRDYYDLRIEIRGGATCTVKDVWISTDKVFIFDGENCYVKNW